MPGRYLIQALETETGDRLARRNFSLVEGEIAVGILVGSEDDGTTEILRFLIDTAGLASVSVTEE